MELPSDVDNNEASEPELKKAKTEELLEKSYLIIYNISKPTNVKTLITLALTFAISSVIIVGQKRLDLSKIFPAMEKALSMGVIEVIRFDRIHQCHEFLQSQNATIYGVEIEQGAVRLDQVSFSPRAIVDRFVYIPQFGGGTASLNVANAAAIVLQRWAETRSSSASGAMDITYQHA